MPDPCNIPDGWYLFGFEATFWVAYQMLDGRVIDVITELEAYHHTIRRDRKSVICDRIAAGCFHNVPDDVDQEIRARWAIPAMGRCSINLIDDED